MQLLIIGAKEGIDRAVVAQRAKQRGLHHRFLVHENNVWRLASARASLRDRESGAAGCGRRLQERAAIERLDGLAPRGIKGGKIKTGEVELHVTPFALGVGTERGQQGAGEDGDRRPTTGYATGVRPVGEPAYAN